MMRFLRWVVSLVNATMIPIYAQVVFGGVWKIVSLAAARF
jgi:hypothetical protein